MNVVNVIHQTFVDIENEHIILSKKEFCGILGYCSSCGSYIVDYTCNADLIQVRPEGAHWDWWASCVNRKCINYYGEGMC